MMEPVRGITSEAGAAGTDERSGRSRLQRVTTRQRRAGDHGHGRYLMSGVRVRVRRACQPATAAQPPRLARLSAHDIHTYYGAMRRHQLSVSLWAELARPLRYNQGSLRCWCRVPGGEWCRCGQGETSGLPCFGLGRAVGGATGAQEPGPKIHTQAQPAINPRPLALARQRSPVPVSNSVASLLPCKQRAAAQHDGRCAFARLYPLSRPLLLLPVYQANVARATSPR